jgi:ParB family chromosome partitioning protein
MDFRRVALSDIDLGDCRFAIRKFSETPRLRDSLERCGILDPVWLCEKSGGYIVVDGFERVGWAKEKGMHEALCRIFTPEDDFARVWTQRIEKKIFEGEINPAEKAQIVGALARVFGPDRVPGFFLASLKVSSRPEAVGKWALLADRGSGMLEALGSGEVCERAAIVISDWDRGSSDGALSVLRVLRCSASIQVEIVERIDEIALREGKTRAGVLEMERVGEIMSSGELNHREKTQALRELFSELRNPRLSARRRRFQQEVEALGLPRGARIVPPEAFEGGGWQMELSFSDPEELRRIFRAAAPLVDSGRLDAILGKP